MASEEDRAIEAITYHVENAQPRQPENLQGLLRYAVEASDSSSHDSPVAALNEERKKFLDAALKSMTVNVTELLRKQIETLQTIESLGENGDSGPYVAALENILDYVDNIDVANDFYKIGGFAVLQPCFKCRHPEVRARACDVLAELCQNNAYCQRMVVNEHILPSLLHCLSSESDANASVKFTYAISCLVRHNSDAFQQMLQYEGFTILLKALQRGNDKLTTKTAFLLTSLCRSQPDLISRLVFLEYIPVLLSLLAKERTPSYEHVLSLVLLLAEENKAAANECKDPKYNLKEILEKDLETIKGKEEFLEEELYRYRLLDLLFK